VAYIDLSAGWVLQRTAGYLIWTEAPQLLACSTRASQERSTAHLSKSNNYFRVSAYISPSLQSTTRVTLPLKIQLVELQIILHTYTFGNEWRYIDFRKPAKLIQ
jgi:hypothetical protein